MSATVTTGEPHHKEPGELVRERGGDDYDELRREGHARVFEFVDELYGTV